jgi:hypothetical protein
MSLQLAAQHLSTKGRGPDDTLVHMSRGEVKSLNDLAMAHGGHLTINPETGLPEAGFLSMILPMVAGAALGPAGFGLTSALGAGLAVGAGSYLLNPKAGLMGALSAGMGAYGAANLGQALAVEGMNASVPAAAQVTPEGINAFTTDPSAYIAQSPTTSQFGAFGEAPTGAQVIAKNAPYSGMSAAPSTYITPPALNPDAANVNGLTLTPTEQFSARNPYAGTQAAQPVRPQVAGFGAGASNAAPAGASNVSFGAPSGGGGSSFATDAAGSFKPSTITQPLVSPNASVADLKDMTVTERLGAIQKGLTSGDLGKVASENYGSVAAVASPLLTKKDESVAPVVDRDRGQQYSYSPGVARPLPAANVPTYEDMLTKQGNFGQQQNYYPDQGYTPISNERAKEMYRYAADGGLMSYANGGPVEQMSNNAAMGANTMYPMANMATSSFATPYQTPQSTNMLANMVAPSGGGAVNAMSGEPSMQGTRMAEGGETTSGYTYDPQTQRYTGIMSSAPMMPTGGGGTPLDYAGAAGNAITDAWNQMHPEAALNGGAGASMSNYSYDPSTQQFTGGSGGGGIPSDQIYLGGGQYGPNAAARKAAEEAAAASASSGYSGNDVSGGMASGGLSDARYNLGGYSDGGRLLRGPGDGVSDSIPAVIGKKQPARLADGEFVVPARIVSELGNGSTEAGARKLYAMMDRIQSARKKTVGKGKVAHNSRAVKYLPA